MRAAWYVYSVDRLYGYNRYGYSNAIDDSLRLCDSYDTVNDLHTIHDFHTVTELHTVNDLNTVLVSEEPETLKLHAKDMSRDETLNDVRPV